jgi:hypothetical protein
MLVALAGKVRGVRGELFCVDASKNIAEGLLNVRPRRDISQVERSTGGSRVADLQGCRTAPSIWA